MLKSIISNHCDTIWDIYAGERVATDKSLLSNRCDTIWDIYACEGFATVKNKTTLIAYIAKETNYTIPNSVTTIGEGAFSDCKSLISINIPNSVTTIGKDAFFL